MNANARLIAIIVVVLVLILIGFLVWGYFGNQNPENFMAPVGQDEEEPEPLITAKHQYRNGTHIIAGEVALPTPCHVLETDALVAESFPEQVTIRFETNSAAEVCAEVITPARFKVEFSASEDAAIRATWDGGQARLNLIPTRPDENLEDFEIFIKG